MITVPYTPARLMAALAFSVVLAACGGGGSSDGGSTPRSNAGAPTPPASGPTPPASGPTPPASNPTPPASNPMPPGSSPMPPAPNPVPSGYTSISMLIQQAVKNVNYFVQTVKAATTDEVTITLPTNANISVGDTIKVKGDTEIRWKIAQNADQTIGTRALPGSGEPGISFTPQASAFPENWWFVASSANGRKLAAVANSSFLRVPGTPPTGAIWTSMDAGVTWAERPDSSAHAWAAIASSSDGTYLAAVESGDKIFISTNSGANWRQQDVALASGFFVSVAVSASGQYMAAVALGGLIYTSENFGDTWLPSASVRDWRSIASSADGKNMVAVAYTDEAGPPTVQPVYPVYTSTDFGRTWAPSGLQTFNFAYRVASSSDGTKLVMGERYGNLYTSADSGATWTNSGIPGINFNAVASSADGNTFAAVRPDGNVYLSTNSGSTWVPRERVRLWRGVALSADGNQVVAAANNGVIYRSLSNRTGYGTTGSVTGGQTNEIGLRYLGDGLFDVIASPPPIGTGFTIAN